MPYMKISLGGSSTSTSTSTGSGGAPSPVDQLLADQRRIRVALQRAVRATTKKAPGIIEDLVTRDVVISRSKVQDVVTHSARQSGAVVRGLVTVKKTTRVPLRDFGAEQGAMGVAYKINTRMGGFVTGAFQGPKPGVINPKWKGRVFKRTNKSMKRDKRRQAIVQLYGPSPWGVSKRQFDETQAEINNELDTQVRKEIDKIDSFKSRGR